MFGFIHRQRPAPVPLPTEANIPMLPRLWPHLLVVLALYAAVYLFVFRGIVTELPSLMRGDSVLSFDEMVPFFDTKTQFWDQVSGKFSELTHGYEFRVRYSFLTTWMRYYRIVPFTIILSTIASTYLAFVALAFFYRRFIKLANPLRLTYAAAVSVLLINLILTYSKITHFYTLNLGFNLFFTSFLLLLAASFPTSRHPLRLLVTADLLAAINPGVHYLVIYSIVHTIVTLFALWRNRGTGNPEPVVGRAKRIWHRSRTFVIANALLLSITLLPYALLTKFFFLYGFENLHDTVPVNYLLIKNSSIALLKQFSLDITSIMDNYLYGRYSPPYPRVANIFYFFVAAIPFLPIVRKLRFPEQRQKDILLCLGIILGLSMWFAMGYPVNPYVPTFHRILSVIVTPLYGLQNDFTELIVKICGTGIEILRFPHRFQFITFAVLIILMPLGIVHLQDALSDGMRRMRVPAKMKNGLLLLFFFIPLFSNWSYRSTLMSGNFNQFMTPYPLKNISEVKDVLDSLPEGKTLVLPPSEAQKRTVDENGVRHKFIDKFFIYYLNKPSYHFGMSGDPDNKNNFFFMLWAMLNNEDWWMSILREQNVRYIVVSKEIGPNALSASEYLRNIEVVLQKNVPNISVSLRKKFENQGFILYELTSIDSDAQAESYLSLNWNNFRCYQEQSSENTSMYNVTLNNSEVDLSRESINIITDNRAKSSMDLYAKLHPDTFFRPDVTILPFTQALVPSSFYFNVIYSMFNVFSVGKYNYLNMIVPGTYDTLTSSFIGMPGSTLLKVPLTVQKQGTYDLYLRSIPTRNRFSVKIDSAEPFMLDLDNKKTKYVRLRTIYSRVPQILDVSPLSLDELAANIPARIIPVNSEYVYDKIATITLGAGQHTVTLDKEDANPFVIEGILLRETGINAVAPIPVRYTDVKKSL